MNTLHLHMISRLTIMVASILFAAAWSDPAWPQTQYAQVKATVRCLALEGAGRTSTPLIGVKVRIKAIGTSAPSAQTDAAGNVLLDYRAYDLAPAMEVVYEGEIATVPLAGPSVSSRLQVMDDGYKPRAENARANTLGGMVRNGVLERGTIEVSSPDCSIWSEAARVLADYHQAIGQTPPASGYKLLRRGGVKGFVPWTSYDTVELPSDYAAPGGARGTTGGDRWCSLLHEFGHTVRHVLDGSHKHFADDVFRYVYGQKHDGTQISNVQFSFNEGWADLWQMRVAECDWTGSRATTSDRDWHEWNVAVTLRGLAAPFGNLRDAGAKTLLDVLRNNPGTIHSLHQFEVAFQKAHPGGKPPPAVAPCPTGYTNDGAFCRRDITQAKPSQPRGAGSPLNACDAASERSGELCYPRCPAGQRGVGPVCWQLCPTGYNDDGAFCRKGAHIFAKSSQGRGAGSPLSCGPGQDKDGGLCYSKCPSGFSGKGPVCWGSCPANTRDDGAVCFGVHSFVIANF